MESFRAPRVTEGVETKQPLRVKYQLTEPVVLNPNISSELHSFSPYHKFVKWQLDRTQNYRPQLPLNKQTDHTLWQCSFDTLSALCMAYCTVIHMRAATQRLMKCPRIIDLQERNLRHVRNFISAFLVFIIAAFAPASSVHSVTLIFNLCLIILAVNLVYHFSKLCSKDNNFMNIQYQFKSLAKFCLLKVKK